MSDDTEDETVAKISDYLDGALAGAERDEVARRIEGDAEWKRIHEELVETRKAISGLQKAHAPASFSEDVTSTIHKRSAGRFFAKKTLGDRVPFGVLLVVALVLLIAVAGVMWSSQTGSLAVHPEPAPTQQGSQSLVPR
jgi:anti-sigma factor RsiW